MITSMITSMITFTVTKAQAQEFLRDYRQGLPSSKETPVIARLDDHTLVTLTPTYNNQVHVQIRSTQK